MIHLDSANITDLEIECVTGALRMCGISTSSPLVDEFEKAMKDYLGVSDCIATNSGTSALHLALIACGIGPEDEVIIPALTFKATENAVRYTGAMPVVVDVDPEMWNLDFDEIDQAINAWTKAIIPVDLYGNPHDDHIGGRSYHWLDKNMKLMKQTLPLVIDASESLGAQSMGVLIGHAHVPSNYPFTCFSFNGNKIMTTGGGGLLIGENLDSIREKIHPGDYEGMGYNYRMTGLSAALGLAQLERLEGFLVKKLMFNAIYREELRGLVRFQKATPDSEPSWWLTACLFPEEIDIPDLQTKMKGKGIPTRRIFKPLADLPNARYIYDHGLCLPGSTLNTGDDILEACKTIKELI